MRREKTSSLQLETWLHRLWLVMHNRSHTHSGYANTSAKKPAPCPLFIYLFFISILIHLLPPPIFTIFPDGMRRRRKRRMAAGLGQLMSQDGGQDHSPCSLAARGGRDSQSLWGKLTWWRGGLVEPGLLARLRRAERPLQVSYREVEGSFLTRRWARKELSMGLSSGVGWEFFRAEYVAAIAP